MRDKLKEMLIRDEGLRLSIYEDSVGVPTIGVGRNLADKGLSDHEMEVIGILHIRELKTITKQQALFLLDNDIDDVFRDIKRTMPWVQDRPEPIKLAVANMVFNLGIHRFLKFKKTIELIRSERYEEASEEVLRSKWSRQVGARAIRISKMILSCAN